MRTITEEMIQDAMKYGVNRTDAERGYYRSCCSDYGNGATHIQKIDEMDVFFSDWDAAAQAERDGIKIIRDLVFSAEHDAPYIDTPSNRLLLKPFVLGTIEPSQQKVVNQITTEKKAACNRIENLIKDAPDDEQIGLSIKDCDISYMAIQTCDDGYDYSFFDNAFGLMDGGQLDEPELSMAQAIYELLLDIEAQHAPLELYDYETLLEKEELSQKHYSIANQAMFHAKGVLLDAGLIQDVTITGYRVYDSPDDSPDDLDYDVLLQYEGNLREDDFFNLLSQHKCIIDGRPIDFNPIRPDKSGTIEEYLRRLEKWNAQ